MNILIACDADANDIIYLEGKALSRNGLVSKVVCSCQSFWRTDVDADIVHIHWPEALFGWREPTEEDIKSLKKCLGSWKKRSKIVATSHNLYPHYRNSEIFYRLYHLVYSHADAIIHMGKASLVDFLRRYPEINSVVHEIIPHGLYSGIERPESKEESRDRLHLSSEEVVFLSFGTLRDTEELSLLLDAFDEAKVARKKLLIAGRLNVSKRNLKGIGLYAKLYFQKNIECTFGFVPRHDVFTYFNASDAVIIPRIRILNSGNVIMGFTLGRCVIGPDTGVVGEILEETGNILYKAGDPRSLARALEYASHIDLIAKGRCNRNYALRHWGWDDVANRHLSLFVALLNK
ncbi:MAG: glycosyltransferase [Methanobacteriota archaeon]|nr:MAG: glycosyltransferase [Euryarchaeota archaeon]